MDRYGIFNNLNSALEAFGRKNNGELFSTRELIVLLFGIEDFVSKLKGEIIFSRGFEDYLSLIESIHKIHTFIGTSIPRVVSIDNKMIKEILFLRKTFNSLDSALGLSKPSFPNQLSK